MHLTLLTGWFWHDTRLHGKHGKLARVLLVILLLWLLIDITHHASQDKVLAGSCLLSWGVAIQSTDDNGSGWRSRAGTGGHNKHSTSNLERNPQALSVSLLMVLIVVSIITEQTNLTDWIFDWIYISLPCMRPPCGSDTNKSQRKKLTGWRETQHDRADQNENCSISISQLRCFKGLEGLPN